jgi:Kef-type K+ transport system membrane component KefB
MFEHFITIIQQSNFYEFSALLILAAAVGFVGLLLRQPVIVSFIAAGILLGPSGLGVMQSSEAIGLLAELGITVLLFLVGLKLDIKLIRTLGMVSLATGLGQVIFTAIIGFFIGLALGMDVITALYVAIALTFSSTIIIVKLLSDKKEVDSLHGRIAIGFLIVQDIFVVLAMMVLSAFGVGTSEVGNNPLLAIGQVLGYGMMMLVLVALFIRYLANPLVSRIAHSPELLVTFAIGLAALLAAVGSYLGFSKELGGLLAGVALASTPFREAIVSRLSSLRDFLLLFFFLALGAHLDISQLGEQFWPALIFSLFVLIGNPIIVMIIMGFMGYRKRTGFLAGLTVAQISEFSLIFIAMGISIGHLDDNSIALVTLVGLITIASSVYMITYSHTLYRFLEPVLGIFERKNPYMEQEGQLQETKKSFDFIVFGLGRYGSALVQNLREDGYQVLAIDFNPDVVSCWQREGIHAMYGDACDVEFITHLPLAKAQWVISAMPEHDSRLAKEDPRFLLIDTLRAQRFAGKIALSTQVQEEVEVLSRYGADLVFLPYHDAAEMAVRKIQNFS